MVAELAQRNFLSMKKWKLYRQTTLPMHRTIRGKGLGFEINLYFPGHASVEARRAITYACRAAVWVYHAASTALHMTSTALQVNGQYNDPRHGPDMFGPKHEYFFKIGPNMTRAGPNMPCLLYTSDAADE